MRAIDGVGNTTNVAPRAFKVVYADPMDPALAVIVAALVAVMVAAIALVTTTNTSLLALTAASRLTYGMADTGALLESVAHTLDA
mgnify:CR=1 FL=1